GCDHSYRLSIGRWLGASAVWGTDGTGGEGKRGGEGELGRQRGVVTCARRAGLLLAKHGERRRARAVGRDGALAFRADRTNLWREESLPSGGIEWRPRPGTIRARFPRPGNCGSAFRRKRSSS